MVLGRKRIRKILIGFHIVIRVQISTFTPKQTF